MSDARVSSLSLSAPPDIAERSRWHCTTLNISLFVVGVLLIIGAITTHCLHVNAIATYSMGGTGGALIVGVVIASIKQCISREEARTQALLQESAEQTRVTEERIQWRKRAENGERKEIEEALIAKSLPPEDLNGLLNSAVKNGHAELVRVLIQHGADPSRRSEDDAVGYCSLHDAINCRDYQKGLDTMKVLLELKPELVHVQSRVVQMTPLHLAAGWRRREDGDIHQQRVKVLLDNLSPINVPDTYGNTPLHYEALSNRWHPNIEVIEALVRRGALRTSKNGQGLTPLQIIEKDHSKWMEDREIQRRLKAVFDHN